MRCGESDNRNTSLETKTDIRLLSHYNLKENPKLRKTEIFLETADCLLPTLGPTICYSENYKKILFVTGV